MSPDPSGSSDSAGRKGEQDAWGAFGLMISGVAVWGGLGWLLSEWLGNRIFLLIGLLVGMSAALYLVWFKYGRS